MNQCEQLHETFVRDILDIIDNVKNHDEIEWIKNRNNVGSIARRTNNLVLVFPVICSSSINIKTASIISKAIERKCVSLLQILFSSMQLTSVDNMYDYLRQFHTNLNLKNNALTLDDFMDAMDAMVSEGVVEINDMELYQAVKEDMHNINYHLSTELNPVSINDYNIRKDIYGESHIVQEAKKGFWDTVDKHIGTSVGKALGKNLNTTVDKSVNSALAKKSKNIADDARKMDKQVDYFRNQLSLGEINKANELMPTTMIVNFTTKNDGPSGSTYHTTTGIIGVKAKLYPVDAMDICNRISSKYTDSNNLFNIVRASTREISFFKDLAFAIDKARLDAVMMAKESNNAKIFKMLERRANKNRFSSLLKKNDASPITSLVISQEEVEYLRKYHTLDMEKSYVTRKVLEGYNLMDIVIADESIEVAKFLFDDGDGVFETLSFDSLEKEAKDSSYKKVVNLMSRLH